MTVEEKRFMTALLMVFGVMLATVVAGVLLLWLGAAGDWRAMRG